MGRGVFPAVRTRRWIKSSLAHQPSLDGPPTSLSEGTGEDFLPWVDRFRFSVQVDDETVGAQSDFVTSTGNTVGIYFVKGEHFVYQEFDGSQWLNTDGAPDPQVIDNDAPGVLFPGRDRQASAFAPRLINDTNNFNGVMAFWGKAGGGDDPGRHRHFVRVHD